MLINEPEYNLSSCQVSVTELSASASINAFGFELPASSTPANTVDSERSVCPVLVSEPVYELCLSCRVSVTNPVRGLPSDCQKRSPLHHIDSHTTQTVTCHAGLQFPSSIALITHTHS